LGYKAACFYATAPASTAAAAAAADHAATVIKRFANQDIVSANEQVVLIGPFNCDDPSNRWTSPQLDAAVQAMWADAELQAAAADMLQLYRSSKQALIHNDLHAGIPSVPVTDTAIILMRAAFQATTRMQHCKCLLYITVSVHSPAFTLYAACMHHVVFIVLFLQQAAESYGAASWQYQRVVWRPITVTRLTLLCLQATCWWPLAACT
jgi:hypothetical protein